MKKGVEGRGSKVEGSEWSAGPITQALECWQRSFKDVRQGVQSALIVRRDREYNVGDKLELREWSAVKGESAGERHTVRVAHVMADAAGLKPGYCMLSIEPFVEIEEDRDAAAEAASLVEEIVAAGVYETQPGGAEYVEVPGYPTLWAVGGTRSLATAQLRKVAQRFLEKGGAR